MNNISFNKFYRKFNILSLILIVISLVFLIFKGLNYGVDFKGGTLIELRTTDKTNNISLIRDSFNQMNLGDVSVKKFGNETDFIVKFEKQNSNDPEFIKNIKNKLSSSIGEIDFRRVENVGPKVSSELLKSGIIAISLSLAAMLLYIWIRFEWQFSLGAILAIFHDVIITLGLFSIPANLSKADILSYLILGHLSTNPNATNPSQQNANSTTNIFDTLRLSETGLANSGSGGLSNTIQSKLGLSELGIETNSTRDVAGNQLSQQNYFVLGKYLSPKLYLRYSQGLVDSDDLIQLRYFITPRWIIQTQLDSLDNSNGIDILYSIER